MTDPEIEDLLRRYRPTGPSADLRASILGDTTPMGRTWPWAVAAAVLLAATLWLHTIADRIAASAAVNVPTDSKQEAIALLSRMLGDGPATRELAEAAIMLDTMPGDAGSVTVRFGDSQAQ